MENKNDRAGIAVEDDGAGLPPGYGDRTFGNMGMTLIRELTEQLHGTFRINRTDEGGEEKAPDLSYHFQRGGTDGP